jgi:Tfp pilus tip-associated adhesin PilY1
MGSMLLKHQIWCILVQTEERSAVMRTLKTAFAVGCALVCVLVTDVQAAKTSPISVYAKMKDVNGKVNGSATIVPNKTAPLSVHVQISLQAVIPESRFPARIVSGTCKKQSSKKTYPLNPVVGGSSSTNVSVSLNELTTSPYAIWVTSVDRFVSCGDIIPTPVKP